MAGPGPQSEQIVEWYLARDGAQHGPLSDVEMRKFVELGHLRPNDLVWRAGFPEWRKGSQVFPELAQPPAPPAPQPPAAPARPVTAPPAAVVQQPQTGWPSGMQPSQQRPAVQAPAPQPARAQPIAGFPTATLEAPQPAAGPSPHTAPLPNLSGLRPAGPLQTRLEALRHPAPAAQAPSAQALSAQDWHQAPLQAPQPSLTGPGGQVAAMPHLDEVDEPEPRGRGSFRRLAKIAAAALIVLGVGWLGWQYRTALPGISSIGNAMKARFSSGHSAEFYQTPPFHVAGESRQDIDAQLQRTALWRTLKRDYAKWYDERVADIERMKGQKADERAVSKFLADVVVVQRRNTASLALASSPDHLKSMASGFLGNLRQLASRDAQTCFGFISFGEASPYMLELTKSPAFAESVQRQLTAIFEAVADGRKQPRTYAATRRADYDVLTAELTARGWSQDDLLTFSDPRRLSSSPPDKVCRMVQDWFTAQLSLKDPELQSRLLSESLKPLVQG